MANNFKVKGSLIDNTNENTLLTVANSSNFIVGSIIYLSLGKELIFFTSGATNLFF